MTNLETVKTIISQLEKNHVNLYHDVSKEQVYNFISSVGDWNSLNEVGFDYQMKKLFALFKDAHTSYFIPGKIIISQKIYFIQNEFYIKHGDRFEKILKIFIYT